MKHYKAPDNSLHCIEPAFVHLLPAGCVEITEAEADAVREANAPRPTAQQVRAERDAKLALCDWTQLSDCSLTDIKKTDWVVYRQALRDITFQPGFPENVQWPITP